MGLWCGVDLTGGVGWRGVAWWGEVGWGGGVVGGWGGRLGWAVEWCGVVWCDEWHEWSLPRSPPALTAVPPLTAAAHTAAPRSLAAGTLCTPHPTPHPPTQVVGLKFPERNGYWAVQLGAGHVKQKGLDPSVAGFFLKKALPFKREVCECRVTPPPPRYLVHAPSA